MCQKFVSNFTFKRRACPQLSSPGFCKAKPVGSIRGSAPVIIWGVCSMKNWAWIWAGTARRGKAASFLVGPKTPRAASLLPGRFPWAEMPAAHRPPVPPVPCWAWASSGQVLRFLKFLREVTSLGKLQVVTRITWSRTPIFSLQIYLGTLYSSYLDTQR